MTGRVDRARLEPPRAAVVVPPDAVARRSGELADAALVVLEAGAGYGKTVLADWLTHQHRRQWYTLTPADRDPAVFVAHLLHGMAAAGDINGEDTNDNSGGPPGRVDWVDRLDEWCAAVRRTTAPYDLVLDDHHHLADSPTADLLERLVTRMPRNLRLVVTTRIGIPPGTWLRPRTAGLLSTVTHRDLTFTTDETVGLFHARYGIELSASHAAVIAEETEGWPLGLFLLGRYLLDRGRDVEAVLAELPDTRATAFSYLSEQVLRTMPADTRRFTQACAVLDVLTPGLCAATAGVSPTEALRHLRILSENHLFCARTGPDIYRLHHLLREHVTATTDPELRRRHHRQASRHLKATGDASAAARHLLAAGDTTAAAAMLGKHADELLTAGQYRTLLTLTKDLPGAALAAQPALLTARSAAARMASDYQAAVDDARRAARAAADHNDSTGRLAAMLAEADVYLDTVRPAQATPVLYAAGLIARRLDAAAWRNWLRAAAENAVNAGRLGSAQRRLEQADDRTDRGLRIRARLLLRRGHLTQAMLALTAEPLAASPDGHAPVGRPPVSHRENQALLAWIDALLGRGGTAAEHARHGVDVGRHLQSPIVEGVCAGRLGLALLTHPQPDPAQIDAAFQRALRIADDIDVARFSAEPLMGSAIASARAGDVPAALRHATRAIAVLDDAGDRYLAALARITLGVAAATGGHPNARKLLTAGHDHAVAVGDHYGPVIAQLWLAHVHHHIGDTTNSQQHTARALHLARDAHLDEIFTSSPWLGIPDPHARRSLLQNVLGEPDLTEYARYLLTALPAAPPTQRPGVPPLALTVLGRFTVRRGDTHLPADAWTRRKAQELLWLLCSREARSVHREEARDALWPDDPTDGDAAGTRLRVALHALRHTLEPDLPARRPSRYIATHGEQIRLTEHVHTDLDDFRRAAQLVLHPPAPHTPAPDDLDATAAHALAVYNGDLLEEHPYLDWAEPLRDSLRHQHIELLIWIARRRLAAAEHAAAVVAARRALDRDPLRDTAWRILIDAHRAAADDTAAARAYTQYRNLSQRELGVTPSW
jgi:LuxR family maltose regulon positive regulatory protein